MNRAFNDKTNLVDDIDSDWAQKVIADINKTVADSLDQMKVKNGDVPLILTGGGSFLVDDEVKGISKVYRPEHYDAANAVGAALGQVSGDVNRIYSFDGKDRDEVLNDAKSEAVQKAVTAGANKDSVEIINIETVPLAYLPGNSAQVKVKAVGDLQL